MKARQTFKKIATGALSAVMMVTSVFTINSIKSEAADIAKYFTISDWNLCDKSGNAYSESNPIAYGGKGSLKITGDLKNTAGNFASGDTFSIDIGTFVDLNPGDSTGIDLCASDGTVIGTVSISSDIILKKFNVNVTLNDKVNGKSSITGIYIQTGQIFTNEAIGGATTTYTVNGISKKIKNTPTTLQGLSNWQNGSENGNNAITYTTSVLSDQTNDFAESGFKNYNSVDDMLFEQTVYGDVEGVVNNPDGTVQRGGIRIVCPITIPIDLTGGMPSGNNAMTWYPYDDVTSGTDNIGFYTKITQNPGETYEQFKARVKQKPMQLGVYKELGSNGEVQCEKVVVYFGNIVNTPSYTYKSLQDIVNKTKKEEDPSYTDIDFATRAVNYLINNRHAYPESERQKLIDFFNKNYGTSNGIGGKPPYYRIEVKAIFPAAMVETTPAVGDSIVSYGDDVVAYHDETPGKLKPSKAGGNMPGVNSIKAIKYDLDTGAGINGVKITLQKCESGGIWTDITSAVTASKDGENGVCVFSGLVDNAKYRIVEKATDAPKGYDPTLNNGSVGKGTYNASVQNGSGTYAGVIGTNASKQAEQRVLSTDLDGYVMYISNAKKSIPVTYVFKSQDGTTPLPTEVKALLPRDGKTYYLGNKVIAQMPAKTTVSTSTGVWTFKSYDLANNEKVVADSDITKGSITITGTWAFESKYTLRYDVQPANVSDGIPSDSKTPGSVTVSSGQTQTLASALTTTSTTNAKGEKGTWKFEGWGTDKSNILGTTVKTVTMSKDITVYGKWIFTKTPVYVLKHVVTPDKKYGVPEGSTTPADSTHNAGDLIKEPDLTTTSTTATANGTTVKGVWEFKTWDKNNFNITENTTITGAWVFKPTVYVLTRVVKPDPTYGKPSDVKEPAATEQHNHGDMITEPDLKSVQGYAVDKNDPNKQIPGVWNFKSWDKNNFPIDKDTTITSEWKFTPGDVKLFVVVEKDEKYGKPAGVKEPENEVKYSYNDKVEVPDLNASEVKYAVVDGEQVPGSWTFVTWDKNNFNITEDTTITGKWIFTPEKYKVSVIVKPDEKYGSPEDYTVPSVKESYDYKEYIHFDDISSNQDYASSGEDKIPGTWTFTTWDTNDFYITKDTTVTGAWVFKPDEFYVNVVIEPDNEFGAPENVTIPDVRGPHNYKDLIHVDDVKTNQDYATVNGVTIKGTWTFITWDINDFQIVKDTTVTGKWQFVPEKIVKPSEPESSEAEKETQSSKETEPSKQTEANKESAATKAAVIETKGGNNNNSGLTEVKSAKSGINTVGLIAAEVTIIAVFIAAIIFIRRKRKV